MRLNPDSADALFQGRSVPVGFPLLGDGYCPRAARHHAPAEGAFAFAIFCITTASAPVGTGAPVAMRNGQTFLTTSCLEERAWTSPISRSKTAWFLWEASRTSRDRTALGHPWPNCRIAADRQDNEWVRQGQDRFALRISTGRDASGFAWARILKGKFGSNYKVKDEG